MVNDRCWMRVGCDNVLPGVPILALNSARDRHVKETVLVAGDSRHSDIG